MNNKKIRDLNILLFLIGLVLVFVFFSLGKKHGEAHNKKINNIYKHTNEKNYK